MGDDCCDALLCVLATMLCRLVCLCFRKFRVVYNVGRFGAQA